MANFIQRASDSISGFGQSYEKFSKQLLIEQYSPGSIKSYGHKLAAISFHFKKLPEHLSEDDCRDYFSMLLSRTPSPGLSYFKHTVYSLRCYRKTMHLSELNFSLPRIRSTKKLPVVLSQSEVISLLRHCGNIRSRKKNITKKLKKRSSTHRKKRQPSLKARPRTSMGKMLKKTAFLPR
jgi:hypothetical protein